MSSLPKSIKEKWHHRKAIQKKRIEDKRRQEYEEKGTVTPDLTSQLAAVVIIGGFALVGLWRHVIDGLLGVFKGK